MNLPSDPSEFTSTTKPNFKVKISSVLSDGTDYSILADKIFDISINDGECETAIVFVDSGRLYISAKVDRTKDVNKLIPLLKSDTVVVQIQILDSNDEIAYTEQFSPCTVETVNWMHNNSQVYEQPTALVYHFKLKYRNYDVI